MTCQDKLLEIVTGKELKITFENKALLVCFDKRKKNEYSELAETAL